MPIKESKFIWMNGEFVNWWDAKIHILSHVIHYGSGVFEGIRCYKTDKGPEIFRLKDHLIRLKNSAKIYRMELPYSIEELREATKELIRKNDLESAYIRPIAYRGYGTIAPNPLGVPVEVSIIAFDMGKYLGDENIKKGINVSVSSWRKFAPDTLPAMAKASGNYLNSQLALMETVSYGFDEAILLDYFGYVSEGSGENIFLVKNEILYTPPLSSSILEGITRDTIIKIAKDIGIEVRVEFIPREALYVADEMFLVGTAAEVTPVISVDKIPVGNGSVGKITRLLQEKYSKIVEGKEEDKYGWCDYVNI
ncbi:MAG: branched-chain amino acid transaminase [Caldisericia bacterium]|jgi:branched-chain amino acid aminotransferase|nr:branched-chain amino acid transaminase [Caldisericia bacterium]